MSDSKVLLYLYRRDLRVADNPVLHELATAKDHGYTHLLPMYIFPAQQVEVSGFIEDGSKSPYPEARSQVGGFWRMGQTRARFLAQSVWDLKGGLEKIGSGLSLRVGMVGEVTKKLLEAKDLKIGGVWITSEEGVEEKREERDVKNACAESNIEFKLWRDEKYFIDDRNVPFKDPQELPDVFTTYRKMVEPLREKPRPTLPTPKKGSLPPFPDTSSIPPQHSPFTIPTEYSTLEGALLKPLSKPQISNPPSYPRPTESVHPFQGGELQALERLNHLISGGHATHYKSSRNGLLGTDFSTKLSAYLSLGTITSRQIHSSLVDFEEGKNSSWSGAEGYNKGANDGTTAVRFELLWRDYMRLCTRKFGPKLFRLSGFRGDENAIAKWNSPSGPGKDSSLTLPQINDMLQRFLNGTTGMGLIDASQRELYHTGYTSNRARQNVASFLAKHLYIDWRIGAEWYESMLVDYDVSSNWGNWQYVAGVGNDPRGEARVFNPVKQAYDYDSKGEYVMAWVDELRGVGNDNPGELFQACTMSWEKVREVGLVGNRMVESPLKRIEFHVNRRGGGRPQRRGRGGGDRRGGGSDGGYWGRGYQGRGSGRGRGGYFGRGGRDQRSGPMDKDREGRAAEPAPGEGT